MIFSIASTGPHLRNALAGALLLTAGTCAAQTVTNGSATGQVGNSMLLALPGWTACSLSGISNTPDVCDITFPSWIGMTTVAPAASPDGGSWIGLANGINPTEQECAIGEMTGLTPGDTYRLSFWGACFGTGPGNYANGGPVVLTMTIDAQTQQFTIPMEAQVWHSYSFCFTAGAAAEEFRMQTLSGGGYGSFDGFTVEPSSPGNTSIVQDTTFCTGGDLLLFADDGNTYQWQDGSAASSLLVDAPGTYWVNVTGGCGLVIDTFHVATVDPATTDLGPDTTLCTSATWTLTPGLPGNYVWQDGSSASTFTVTGAGDYWVHISGGTCGTVSDTVTVTVAPPPPVDLGLDTLLCAGNPLLLDATLPDASYHWQNGSTGPTLTATMAGTYWVEVTVEGCSARDSIQVSTVDCGVEVTMPNVFSPNGDGHNDVFLPVVLRGVDSSTMTIYNRWGQAVFQCSDVRQGWDGRISGEVCAEGTYYWYLRYHDTQGEASVQSGPVTVLR